MIDAYTIGVTLALEDGVSDGLVNVKRELQIIDRAIAQSAAGMEELCRLGQQLGTASEAPLSVTPHPTIKAIVKPTAEDTPTSDRSTQTPGAVPLVPPPPRFAFSPVLTAQPKPDGVAAPPAALAKAVSADQPVPRTQTLPTLPQAPLAKGPDPKSTVLPLTLRQFAPKVALGPHTPDASGADTNDPPAAPDFVEMQLPRFAPASVAPTSASEWEATPAPDAAPSPSLSLRIAPVPPVPPPAARPRSLPVLAPPEVVAQRSPRPARATEPTPSFRPAAQEVPEPPDMPAAREAAGRPAHVSGDITIDGARLGRWVGEALTSALNRPAAGLTGVDPRAMPTWPTMQGR